jgi:hypothetical protein
MSPNSKLALALLGGLLAVQTIRADLAPAESPAAGDFVLASPVSATAILVETNASPSVARAAKDLAEDIFRVSGHRPKLVAAIGNEKQLILIGTVGQSPILDSLSAQLDLSSLRGQWESYHLHVVAKPLPGVSQALVIAGSDRRGAIFGIYDLSERIGVSPWYWWADVPVRHRATLALHGTGLKQGPPAVKYRGIFLNDEDWCLRAWAAKTFEPEAGNIGPRTYEKIFELLLRLRANYLWPAMHPQTSPFNANPANKTNADYYGIVMGSSHCEQMLRDNVEEWDAKRYGAYDYVTNRDGVLKYWEERVRENGRFENIYTLGMRGVHDSGMPGGGTVREKSRRLLQIIADQRNLLSRHVNTNLAAVPQIFCPYKEVLELYRLAPNIPEDITLVWPDDNYGYIRSFSSARERQRGGGGGVYYHVSYWGRPQDYLWLGTTPPALMAEEMVKAYEYGADRVWVLNVGDLKPDELSTEFFLNLAWAPRAWHPTNTSALLEKSLARDFGSKAAPALTAILNEYYRLSFSRKPEHLAFAGNPIFSTTANGDEAQARMDAWSNLVTRLQPARAAIAPEAADAFFELVDYPVRGAALLNHKWMALTKQHAAERLGRTNAETWLAEAHRAHDQIEEITRYYNEQLAGGKWRGMMYSHPHNLATYGFLKTSATNAAASGKTNASPEDAAPAVASAEPAAKASGADFVESRNRLIIEAERASKFVPGKEARWEPLPGVGYNGCAVSIRPVTAAPCEDPARLKTEAPCLEYSLWLEHVGEWTFTARLLPTFSLDDAKPEAYAIAIDEEAPKVVTLPGHMHETDRQWQENVLRNAQLSAAKLSVSQPGLHRLRIWMVTPGVVLDAILAQHAGAAPAGYAWQGSVEK